MVTNLLKVKPKFNKAKKQEEKKRLLKNSIGTNIECSFF
jgi:hypothetical protein